MFCSTTAASGSSSTPRAGSIARAGRHPSRRSSANKQHMAHRRPGFRFSPLAAVLVITAALSVNVSGAGDEASATRPSATRPARAAKREVLSDEQYKQQAEDLRNKYLKPTD